MLNNWNGGIRLFVIEHKSQRYDTCGDWTLAKWGELEGLGLNIYISQTGDSNMNFCLFMHELNEALLYLFKNGFTSESAEAVDNWDKGFIESSDAEPGGDNGAPYFTEHMFAMSVEHLVAEQLDIDWNDYTDTIKALEYLPKKESENG